MVEHVSLEEQTIVQLECEPQNQTKYYTHPSSYASSQDNITG